MTLALTVIKITRIFPYTWIRNQVLPCGKVCRGQPSIILGFLLLRYSVLFTAESLSLLYLLLNLDLFVLGDDALIS